MSGSSFTKLFGTILASTVWQEPNATRLTWITMLAMADKNGVVSSSVPGLAHFARVTVSEVEDALRTFMAPDPYSRTPDNDGRRIEPVQGGWRLLNHGIYRERQDSEAQRERKREWDRKNRPSGHARAKSDSAETVRQSDGSPTRSDEIRHIAEAEADTERSTNTVHPAAPAARCDGDEMPQDMNLDTPPPAGPIPKRITGDKAKQTTVRFAEFWAAYPVKKGRADALKKWKVKGCDAIADQIIGHVRRMEAEDDQWRRGFIPHGSTYVNGEGWNDEPFREKDGTAVTAPPPKVMGSKAALSRSETPLEAALGYIRQQYNLGAYGEGEAADDEMRRLVAEATEKHRGKHDHES